MRMTLWSLKISALRVLDLQQSARIASLYRSIVSSTNSVQLCSLRLSIRFFEAILNRCLVYCHSTYCHSQCVTVHTVTHSASHSASQYTVTHSVSQYILSLTVRHSTYCHSQCVSQCVSVHTVTHSASQYILSVIGVAVCHSTYCQ